MYDGIIDQRRVEAEEFLRQASVRLLAGLMANQEFYKRTSADLAKMAVEGAKALVRALAEDAKQEAAKAKVLAETKGSDV